MNKQDAARRNPRNLADRRSKSWPALVFLLLSGLLLLGIGGAILLVPHAFYAGNGILLGEDPSLLSEIRAPGGLLAASAILILLGTVRPAMRSLAVTLSVLVYGSFGLSRLVGLALDGMPAGGIAGAAVIELIVAALGLLILRRRADAGSPAPSHELAAAPASS